MAARLRRATPADRRAIEQGLDRMRRGLRVSAPRVLREALEHVDPADVQAAIARAADAAAAATAADVTVAYGRAARGVRGMMGVPGRLPQHDRAAALVRSLAARRWGVGTEGGWSAALHGRLSRSMSARIGSRVERVVRGLDAAGKAAQELRDLDRWRVAVRATGPGSVRIPRRILDLQRAAKGAIRAIGDPRAAGRLRSVLARMDSATALLAGHGDGTAGIGRSLMADIERAVRSAKAGAVDDAVAWWGWKREAVHQRAVVEYEAQGAWSRAYVEQGTILPWVTGWEWITDADPCPECEALSGRIMDRASLIIPPLHLHCQCLLVEVVDPTRDVSEAEWQALEAAERAAA